jgi:hypothetical protein
MRSPLLIIHHAGQTFTLAPSDEHTYTSFGGPCETKVSGAELPRPLHLIGVLSHSELSFLAAPSYVFEIPLLYGMRYDGGTTHYTFSREGVVVLPPLPALGGEDWPYRGYPELLPYYPLEIVETIQETWDAFAERAPNLPDEQPASLVVLVPPPHGLGFTLWGRSGDAEGVTLVFECDLTGKQVVAYNVCS